MSNPTTTPTDGAAGAPTPAHSQSLAPKEARQFDECRDAWLILQAAAEGYRQSVRSIEWYQGLLDVFSILVSIWLIVVLWGIKELIPAGADQAWIATVVNVVGTVFAFILLSLTVASWRQEWRGKADRHRELASESARLATRFYDLFQETKIDEGKLTKAKSDRAGFVNRENQPLGGIPQWARQRGFQHVGQSHPGQNIRCNSCSRCWEELNKLRSSWWRGIVFGKCENCGVPR